MRKVLICGTTQGSNFGDILFAYMFKKNIEVLDSDADIYFSKSSDYAKQIIGIKEATLKDMLNMDAMVYMSGNYFGEAHNENLKGSIRRVIVYFTYGMLMILRKKPIAIIGVGAGPLNKTFLRKIAVYIFNKAKIISVRDLESYEYMKSYNVKSEMIITSDSAQMINKYLPNTSSEINKIINDNKLKDKHIVLVHSTTSNETIYREKVIDTLIKKYRDNPNIGFILANDNITSSKEIERISKLFPSEQTVVYDFYNPIEFVELISAVDTIITPKLHAGIIGCTYNKSVLSFAIHPSKTKRYFKQIGYSKRTVSLFDTTQNEVSVMMDKYLMENIELPNTVRDKSQKNFLLLKDFYSNFVFKQ